MDAVSKSDSHSPGRGFSLELMWVIGLSILCLLGQTFAWQTIISEKNLMLNFCSAKLWGEILQLMNAEEIILQGNEKIIEIPLFPCCLFPLLLWTATLIIAGLIEYRNSRNTPEVKTSFPQALINSTKSLLPWGMLPGLWFIMLLAGLIAESEYVITISYGIPQYTMATSFAGIIYVLFRNMLTRSIAKESQLGLPDQNISLPWQLGLMIGIYTIVYTILNWFLYYNLRMPHGDSAMYEEHLFNLLHGKGFRSYLDQGLFLGEHIQVIHLLLIPVYYWWQSVLFIEFLQSFCLAVSAIPVYRMASRASGSQLAGLFLAAAVLVYFPLQFLDISIDLKTFRPTAFCIPALLFALEALELKRYNWMSFWLTITLTGQEDLTLVVGPIALWLLVSRVWDIVLEHKLKWKSKLIADAGVRYGLFWMLLAPLYLLFAMQAIHWFRGGIEIHYAGYFQKFGKSMSEVMQTMLLNPGMVLQELAVTSTLTYFLALMLPLGFLSLRSPGRLLTGSILFVTLCLNELNEGRARAPHYHFHAPIIPIIFWSAALGLKPENNNASNSFWLKIKSSFTEFFFRSNSPSPLIKANLFACLAISCGLATGFFYTLSPFGIPFWDHGSDWHYLKLYVQNERARMFEHMPEIPLNCRVASTDFVHPRFTHHERSYDYSQYKRRQSNFEDKVPDDTDYIVIDTSHPYSTIKHVEELREWQEEQDQWELLPDKTKGYFIVLKKRNQKFPYEPATNPTDELQNRN